MTERGRDRGKDRQRGGRQKHAGARAHAHTHTQKERVARASTRACVVRAWVSTLEAKETNKCNKSDLQRPTNATKETYDATKETGWALCLEMSARFNRRW